jgi:hypothetical protein
METRRSIVRRCYISSFEDERRGHEPRNARRKLKTVGKSEADVQIEPLGGVWPYKHLDLSCMKQILT